MTQPTPGNWRIQNTNDDYTRYQIEAEGWGIIMHIEDDSDQPLDNARLIAAAPALLHALEYIIHWRADHNEWNPEIARDLASTAIAQARGESK